MLPSSLQRLARPVASLLGDRLLARPQLVTARFKRYQAFGADLDQDALAEARAWFKSFDPARLPRGSTSFARSSGPGGQHVNKTETKAITTYAVKDILLALPKTLHAAVRSSKYYTAGSDCLTFAAQTHRSRTTNADENRQKLVDEVMRIYQHEVPSETSREKTKKHEQIEKKFHQGRLQQKKLQSAKKQSRRGPPG
ncbi:hypothetical protein ESCO_002676 [Escovopsis weberi]|uniref:Prokaryotic-type class I peptide chain release factors domain-containing protein n=1 Tax=Escovopsis weberi TaxID=150374 RepID=A0A0M8MRK0_ESCWE|nr:hypothetical protein ESCO_002676 [Escovopsis weberi]